MKLLLLPFRFVLGFLLLALLTPLLFYLLTPFLPLILIVSLAIAYYKHHEMKDGTPKSRALVECMGIMGPFVLGIALCRAFMVLTYSQIPSAAGRAAARARVHPLVRRAGAC